MPHLSSLGHLGQDHSFLQARERAGPELAALVLQFLGVSQEAKVSCFPLALEMAAQLRS